MGSAGETDERQKPRLREKLEERKRERFREIVT